MPDKPYEFAHPQFDKENWEKWEAFLDGDGQYVDTVGLRFRRPKNAVSER